MVDKRIKHGAALLYTIAAGKQELTYRPEHTKIQILVKWRDGHAIKA